MILLSIVDWIILAILLVSTSISFVRGFVREALSLATWVAAIIIARLFAGQLSSLLVEYIEVQSIRIGASYILLIVSTLVVGAMVNHLVCELVKMTGLSGTDRFLGMFFGLARGAVVVLIVVAMLYYLAPIEGDGWWSESVLIPEIVKTIEWLGPVLWEQGGQFVESTSAEMT